MSLFPGSVINDASAQAMQDRIDTLRATNLKLRMALEGPITEAERKLIDKHCDWVAFGHAWNAVIKLRRAAIEACPS